MAFRRISVRLNGGVSGPGSVAGYNLGTNADAFVEDGLAPDPGSTWFRFELRIGRSVADPRAAWKVLEGSGRGDALFRVTELRTEGPRPLGLETEFRR